MASYQKAFASLLWGIGEHKPHRAMSHYFPNMLLVVGRVALPLDSQLFACFGVAPETIFNFDQ